MPAPAPVIAAVRGWFEALLAGDAAALARVAMPHAELATLVAQRPAPATVARLRGELQTPQVRVLELANDRLLAQVYLGGSVQLLPLQRASDGVRVDPRYALAATHPDDAPRTAARAFYRALLFGELAALQELSFDARGVELLVSNTPPGGEHGQLEMVVAMLALVELALGEPFTVPSGTQFVTPRHVEMGIRVYTGLTPDGEIPFLLRERDGAWKVIPFHFIQSVAMARGAVFGPSGGNDTTKGGNSTTASPA